MGKRGNVTPIAHYRDVILDELAVSGPLFRVALLNQVWYRMREDLTGDDWLPVRKGEPRWWKNVDNCLTALRREGLVTKDGYFYALAESP